MALAMHQQMHLCRESFHLHTEQSEQFIIHTLPQPGFNQPARVVHHDDQVAGPSALQTDTLSGM